VSTIVSLLSAAFKSWAAQPVPNASRFALRSRRGHERWVVTLGLLGIAGCAPDQPTTPLSEPSQSSSSAAAQAVPRKLLNEDDALLELSARAPGFGGLAFDEDGVVVVYVTDLAQSTSIGSAVSDFMRGREKDDGVERTGRAPQLRFVKADFDWPTIKTWKERLREVVFRDPGVSFIDADEGHNRITVAVTDRAAERRVQELVRSAGAPENLVRYVQEAKPSARTTLQQAYSPRIGGLQIENGQFLCTLGAVGVYNGQRALVTNSHCTAGMFQNASTSIAQGGVTIGTEVFDPPLFQGISGCPSGRWCRMSDAAVVLFGTGIASDYSIAFTSLSPCVNSSCGSNITITGAMPVTDVGFPSVTQGMTLNKTGRTSGWTRGTVTNTCADTPADPLYWPAAGTTVTPLLLCQIHTTIWSEPGDSGSPIYTRQTLVGGTPGTAVFYGIMWGGPPTDFNVTWISPVSGLDSDLGYLLYY